MEMLDSSVARSNEMIVEMAKKLKEMSENPNPGMPSKPQDVNTPINT